MPECHLFRTFQKFNFKSRSEILSDKAVADEWCIPPMVDEQITENAEKKLEIEMSDTDKKNRKLVFLENLLLCNL